jgi:hypothetical protein
MGLIRGVVKVVGVLMTLVTSVLLLALGIALIFRTKYEIWEGVYRQVDTAWKNVVANLPEGVEYRYFVAVITILAGLLVLWSVFIRGKRRRRSISFLGAHGEVTIELENVEGTLEKVALKLPEVVDVAIRLEPTEARSRVLVLAQAVLLKDADIEAKQVTDRVQEYLRMHTQKILGVQEVDIRLTVKKFRMNMKSLKPMPLLLSGPENANAVAKVMNDGVSVQSDRTAQAAQPS